MNATVLILVLLAVAAVVAVAVAVAFTRGRGTPEPSDGQRASVAAPPRVEGLGGRIRALLSGRSASEVDWASVEDLLVKADVGPKPAAALVERVRARHGPEEDPVALVEQEVAGLLGGDPGLRLASERLSVVLVVGVNGSGKTTTIGKLAKHLAGEGRSVTLAATDTFRAAANEQLDTWAERAGVQLIAQERGADPGAVAFDAVEAARARGSDVLIVDTAGRLHTKTPLMEELRKVRRVIEKAGGTIDETLLVLDATTGQNGIAQARAFTEAVEVTGVALTKLDGTAKGGIVLAVREELGVPVKLVGTGEGIGDLEPFDAAAFAARVVGT